MRDFLQRVIAIISSTSKRTKLLIAVAFLLIALFFVGRYYYNQHHISDYSEMTMLVNDHKYIEAEQRIGDFLVDNAKDPYFLVLIARTYVGRSSQSNDPVMKKGYLLKSIQALNDAERINGNIVEIFRIKGLVYLNLGEFKLSETFYRKAISLEPKSVSTLNDLGNLMLIKKDIDQAYQSYKTAIDLEPQNEQAKVGLIRLMLIQSKYDQALGQARVLYENTTDSNVKVLLGEIMGNIYSKLTDYSKAIQSYNNVITINPNSVYALYGLAEVSFAKNFNINNISQSTLDAVQYAKKTIDVDPAYPHSYVLLARLASLNDNKSEYDTYSTLAKATINDYLFMNKSEKEKLLALIPDFGVNGSNNVKIKVLSARVSTTTPSSLIRKK